MKFSIGSYEVRIGRYVITPAFSLAEFRVSGPLLWIDVDWTDSPFPVGWCAGLALGRGEMPGGRWRVHWAWNAPHGESNHLDFTLGPVRVDFSCFTWWKMMDTGVAEERTVGGRAIPVHRIRYVRCRPYLEDGWPPVRFSRA